MDIILYAPYINSTTTLGETGLTPTATIWQVLKVSPYTKTEVVSAQTMTEIGRGIYFYPVSDADLLTYDYLGVSLTSSSNVISKELHMLRWDGAEEYSTELSRVDVTLSTIPSLVWAAGSRTLTSFGTLIADIWRNPTRTLTMTRSDILSGTPPSGTNYNFPTHVRGDTVEKISFTVSVNGSPLNLTGATIEMYLRKDANRTLSDGLLLTTFTTVDSGGLTVASAVDGEFDFDKQIVDVIPGTHNYDIEITLSDLSVYTYISGEWTITQDITNDR